MLTKVSTLLRVAPRVQNSVRSMGGHGTPAHFKPMRQVAEENKTHMNCLPIPEGSWQEHHSARNGKWNLMVAAGLVSLVATYSFLWQNGVFYFHSAPPMYNCKKE